MSAKKKGGKPKVNPATGLPVAPLAVTVNSAACDILAYLEALPDEIISCYGADEDQIGAILFRVLSDLQIVTNYMRELHKQTADETEAWRREIRPALVEAGVMNQ